MDKKFIIAISLLCLSLIANIAFAHQNSLFSKIYENYIDGTRLDYSIIEDNETHIQYIVIARSSGFNQRHIAVTPRLNRHGVPYVRIVE